MDKPKAHCPHCGALFRCGVLEDIDDCWCYCLPPIKVDIDYADDHSCLCPHCLNALVLKADQKKVRS